MVSTIIESGESYTDKDYAIWGAGRIGEAAFIYFQDYVNIAFYVDNNEKKWGSTLNGLKIYSPDILYHRKIKVIIAMKNGQEDIRKCLEKKYGITNYTTFSFIQKNYVGSDCDQNEELLKENSVIICCSDGLGNQMFQYALYRNLQDKGRNVYFDISSYDVPGPNKFLLREVFPDISLRMCSKYQAERFICSKCADMYSLKTFQVYAEPGLDDEKIKRKNESLFHIDSGVIRGYHQCYQYAEEIREKLLTDFSFPDLMENSLMKIAEEIKCVNAVSVHVRRGDYLKRNISITYSGICTNDYYRATINYMKEKENDTVFYFFSNEILWVKEHLAVKNAVYIDQTMFDDYQDWYDMYLMSLCKHNIIANSTFSWWGAWLNQNKNKIVIAPSKWANTCDYVDICPLEWTKFNEKGELYYE